MLNMDEFAELKTPTSEVGHRPASRVIMHWVEACPDPGAHGAPGESSIATDHRAHRDQLVSVWVDGSAAA